MKNKEEEYYVFMKACENDFRVALKSYEFFPEQKTEYQKLVYLRDAVISYSRPFSGNKGKYRHKLILKIDMIPRDYHFLHKEILRLRNTLFAHSDIKERNPDLCILGDGEDEKFVLESRDLYLSNMIGDLSEMSSLINEIRKNLKAKMVAHAKYL